MDTNRQLIVVVEDDPSLGRALERLLGLSGFRTLLFESAEALMSVSGTLGAHCLILDIQLPGISGPTFYGRLGQRRPPVVFITSHDSAVNRNSVMEVGGKELLTKPFPTKDLLDAISRSIQRGAPT